MYMRSANAVNILFADLSRYPVISLRNEKLDRYVIYAENVKRDSSGPNFDHM